MSNKSPYELRYELLMMAQGILTEQLMNERIRLENNWNMECEAIRIAREMGVRTSFPEFPEIPKITEEQIIAMAEKLNEFVSKPSTKE